MAQKKDWCKHKGNRVLLVEGKNDCHVISALCQAHNLPETFGIYQCDGDIKLFKRLDALIPSEDIEIIGIVLDADNPDVKSRWRQVQNALNLYNYEVPKQANPQGTIISSQYEKPRLGIWLMPNNQDAGMLEDFLMGLAQPESLNWARNCVDGARKQNLTSFKEVHHSKAVIHTYLAMRDEPGNPLGQAITAHALQPQTEIAHHFTSWLNRLFNECVTSVNN
jgi:hypothetical protein